MKTLLSIMVGCLLLFEAVAQEAPENNARILLSGCHHGDEVPTVVDQNWLGLFSSGPNYHLDSVTVTTRPCHDVMVDNNGETTGVEVVVSSEAEPILLIQHVDALRSGAVSAYFDKTTSLELGEPVYFKGHAIAALGTITDEGDRPPGDLLIENYQLKLYELTEDNRSQVLLELPRASYDGLPTIVWAGDLDRDGRVDLLLDIRDHYNVEHLALYLSSAAGRGDLVGRVAEFRITGC